ncbi:MAG TPA: L,D-transpeptidase [Chloroflexota bacterium]|nr:L,D-transpeptidase [Chloroflexota bacterium]
MAIPTLSIAPRAALPTAVASKGLLLQPTLLTTHAAAGQRAGLFVHAPAAARLTLAVTYPGGASSFYQGKTDGQGRFVFSWTIPAGLRQSGDASLRVTVQRDNRTSTWLGTLQVSRAPLPPLFVQATAGRFLAGTTIGIFVSTAPRTTVTYQLTAPHDRILAHGSVIADARGRTVIGVPERYLPQQPLTVTASITVKGVSGSRTGTTRFTLLPRPPLPIAITLAHSAVHAGQPLSVTVSSAPDTTISLTVALNGAVLAHGSGVTDGAGRWTFTTNVFASLTQAKAAQVTVHASRGIDSAISHSSFLLQPASQGIVDQLAGPSNPAPNLSSFFTQIPDRVIVVSTESQTMRAYDHGVLIHEDYVTTGRPELPTPHGIFQVLARYSPYEFISPWPMGSPYYYPPSPVHFAMLFRDGGYFLHDAPWRSVYGPGTNLPHSSDPGEPLGTHGCVNFPYADMVWLWNWSPDGTTVLVN